MIRELLIVRHAKSAWHTDAASDFDRPLSKRGKRDAPRLGAWLRQQALVPDRVVSSPAKRARKTAVEVCRELGIEKTQVIWEPRIYEATCEELLSVLQETSAHVQRLMLVGHNPGLEDLIKLLCKARPAEAPDNKLLPTASVARLKLYGDWSELACGSAELIDVTKARTLA